MVVCQEDGTVQVLLDEAVKIGQCKIDGEPIFHSSHSSSAYHAILSQNSASTMDVCFVQLPLSTLGGPLLHVIANNTKRMQNLSDYTLCALRCIEHDFVTGLQFPARLLNSLNEMLSEQEEGDAQLSLYHLAMTGDFTPAVLEWLTDIVKDTNHKRWDSAIGGMYQNIQHHLFINVLPALERFSIAASELRGQAAFYEGSSKFDCAPEFFTHIISSLDGLRLVAEKCLSIVIAEHKQFRAFSKWLKLQVEVGNAEPLTNGALEIEEREVPSIEYSLVLKYIKDTMTRSALTSYVQARPDLQGAMSKEAFMAHPFVTEFNFASVKIAMEQSTNWDSSEDEGKHKASSLSKAMLNLPAIGAVLSANVRVAVDRITSWQSRMLEPPIKVTWESEDEVSAMDMGLIPPAEDEDEGQLPAQAKILVVPTSNSPDLQTELEVVRFVLRVPSGTKVRPVSSTRTSFSRPVIPSTALERASLYTMEGGSILDAKFISPEHERILVLIRRDEEHGAFLVHRTTQGVHMIHAFPDEKGFAPQRLTIGGRRGKMVCIIIGNRGRDWVVLDLQCLFT